MFKCVTIVLICFLAFHSTLIYAQWTVQQLPTTQALTDVYFADTSNGWICGVDGIFHTTDGGSNWLLQYTGGVAKLSGLSSSECWAKFSKKLLHTTDTGVHWDSMFVGQYFDFDSIKFITQIFFLDCFTGWVIAQGYKNNATVGGMIRTTDGGKTWLHYDIQSLDPGVNYSTHIQFFDYNIGWIMGQSPLYRTNNGGASWDSLSNPGYGKLLDLQFLNPGVGWISSDAPVIATQVLKTVDSGKTWSLPLSFECSDLATYLRFADTFVGWVIQSTCIDGGHTEILHTSDGGTTWDKQFIYSPDFYYRANRVYCTDRDHVWIVGEHGILFRTSNGGVTGIEESKDVPPKEFSLMQNYPNPFNPSTIIKYELKARGHISIKVFNVLSQEVVTVLNETKEAGTYTVEWNGKDNNGKEIGCGVYFYRMIVIKGDGEVFISLRKMILLR